MHHGSPGLTLVRSKRYAIQNSRMGKDAETNAAFYKTARPGDHFTMSMIFNGDWDTRNEDLDKKHESKCPSCGHLNGIDKSDLDVLWCVPLVVYYSYQ